MKKKRVNKSRCAVEIDAEQMEYLRYYHKLTGQPIASILRDMIAQWVALEYATRVATPEPTGKVRRTARSHVGSPRSPRRNPALFLPIVIFLRLDERDPVFHLVWQRWFPLTSVC